MAYEILFLEITKILTVIMGGILTWLSYKGHKHKNSTGLLFLAIGFATITIGSLVEGVLFEFFHYDILTVHLFESIIVVLGLLSLIYAVYGVAD
ncbi:MAG: hypothetical protein HYU39_08350 [Thaumarchaeota archaeon]|nr:hypothetical protein [Nitrososphaerota archaeon]